MKYRIKLLGWLRKLLLFVYFKFDPIGCSRFMGVSIGQNCRIYGNSPNMWGTEPFLISIGDNVHITNGCYFINHDGGTLIYRKDIKDLEITAPISVGNDVYLGVQCLIMPGVTIGNNVVVGARSVVTKDLTSNAVYAGIPARFIKSSKDYLDKLERTSLKLGHLDRDSKEDALRKLFLKK